MYLYSPYARCRICGKIIRLNKFILGSLHFCEPEQRVERQMSMTDFVNLMRASKQQNSDGQNGGK